jgi:hypothetical protein
MSAMTDMTEADVLDKAAKIIEERGWCQGKEAFRSGGPTCAAVAIGIAAPVGTGLRGQAERFLHHWLTPTPRNVIFWNDAPGRTADEVITALRSAAAAWRAEHAQEVAR